MSTLKIYDTEFTSRLLVGTSRYPSPQIMKDAIVASGTEMVTVSLRRQQSNPDSGHEFWELIQSLGVQVLPNTAGCESVSEVITLAHMSREVFSTDFIKLEVIGDNLTLQPEPVKTIECAKKLIAEGFKVLPYCTDDLVLCQQLVNAGCEVIMPWAAPIGTGRGMMNPYNMEVLRQRLPDTTIIIDAGLGKPSHVVNAMEMGFDAVLLNTAIAKSQYPILMAESFRDAVCAGRKAYDAVPMLEKNIAAPSTPVLGMPFRG